MLDGKILAAVLATLTAIAVSSGQGVEAQSLDLDTPTTEDFEFQDILDNPVNNLRNMFTETPEPENSVEATLKVESLSEESMSISRAEVVSNSTKSVQLGSKKVESDSEITFYGFEGAVTPVNDTMVSGTVAGAVTSGVNISGQAPVSQSFNTSRLEINGVERSKINFGQVKGSIDSESASTEFSSSRPLNINSFSGDIVIYPRNSTVVLDGKVARLEAGSFTFGG
ncbi:MAG: hypothetical protein ACI9LV_000186 [Candidatus Nanohaloarchaea archaeon]|jgi:hypothetical protein